MTFAEIEAQYRTLKAQQEAGALSEADFKARLQDLMLEDEQGRWWVIGAETGQWYVHEGEKWTPAQPPGRPSGPAVPVASPEIAEPAKTTSSRPIDQEPPRPRPSPAPASPAGRPRTPILIGAAGLLLVAVVAVIAVLPRLRNDTGAPPATPTSASQAPVLAATTQARSTAMPSAGGRSLTTPTVAPTKAPAKATSTATGLVTKILRINESVYPETLDPQKASFTNETGLLGLIYEGLTRLDSQLNTVPGAAESWAYNGDATELTFTLRQGLKYSDGSVLNAKRFEYALLRTIDPETAADYVFILDEIQGAVDWSYCDVSADAADCDTLKADVGVKALHADGSACSGYTDPACNTLSLTFAQPAAYFHTVMSLWVAYPAKEENIESSESWWNSARYQVGNGPFVLKSLEPSVRAHLAPNAYFQGSKAKTDIELSFIEDLTVALDEYKDGKLDIISPAAEEVSALQASSELREQLMIYPGFCTWAVMFNHQKEPFTDQKVREAFAQALDRQAWVRDVLAGVGTPTLNWIPPESPGYDAAEKRWDYNPDAAKQALASSKYGSAAKLPSITVTFSDSARNRAHWEWLAQQWKSVLGVNVKLNPVESSIYATLSSDPGTSSQIVLAGWCADFPDPRDWLSVYWRTGAFADRIGYSNPAFDELVDEADLEEDPEKRAELYMQAQRLLIDGAPAAFMWNNINVSLVKPWVKGVVITPLDAVFPGSVNPTSLDIDISALPK